MLRYKENSPEIHRTFLNTVVLLSTLEWFVDLLYFLLDCYSSYMFTRRASSKPLAMCSKCSQLRVSCLLACAVFFLLSARCWTGEEKQFKDFYCARISMSEFSSSCLILFLFFIFCPIRPIRHLHVDVVRCFNFFWWFSFVSHLASVTSECVELNSGLLL